MANAPYVPATSIKNYLRLPTNRNSPAPRQIDNLTHYCYLQALRAPPLQPTALILLATTSLQVGSLNPEPPVIT